jgi:hypothetical protein
MRRRTARRHVRRDPPSAKVKKEFERLRKMGFSPADATKVAKFRARWIGHIGDVSWEDHDGGPVFESSHYPGQYVLEYVEAPYSYGGDMWTVYRVDLDGHTFADYLGLDYHSRQLPLRPPKELKSVADTIGMDWKELAEAVWSENPMVLASLAEAISAYYGWRELDYDPLNLTYDEFVLRYGEEPSERPEDEERDPQRRSRRRRR